MSENGDKCGLVLPKTKEDTFKCLVLETIQKYTVYCHKGIKKLENIQMKEAGITEV